MPRRLNNSNYGGKHKAINSDLLPWPVCNTDRKLSKTYGGRPCS